MHYTTSLVAFTLLATTRSTAATSNSGSGLVRHFYSRPRVLGRAPQVSIASTVTDGFDDGITDTCDQEGASCTECFGPGFVDCPGDSETCYDPNDGGQTYCPLSGTGIISNIGQNPATSTQSLRSNSGITMPSITTGSDRATGTASATTSTGTGAAVKLTLPAKLLGGVAVGVVGLL